MILNHINQSWNYLFGRPYFLHRSKSNEMYVIANGITRLYG